jgi:hypothetical protein
MAHHHFHPDSDCEIRYSQKQLLFEILCILRRTMYLVSESAETITVTRNQDPVNPIVPGTLLDFTATVAPSGAETTASEVVWTSSDTTNFPVTQSTGDPTGLTATVSVPLTAVLTPSSGVGPTVTCTVTNSDGTTAVGVSSPQPIVAADITAVTVDRTS